MPAPLSFETSDLSFGAPSMTFLERLEGFSNDIDIKTTLVAFISLPGGDKVECRGSEQNVAPVVTPVTFPRRSSSRIDRGHHIYYFPI